MWDVLCFVLWLFGIFAAMLTVAALGAIIVRIIGACIYYVLGVYSKFDRRDIMQQIALELTEWYIQRFELTGEGEELARAQLYEMMRCAQEYYVKRVLLKVGDPLFPTLKDPEENATNA